MSNEPTEWDVEALVRVVSDAYHDDHGVAELARIVLRSDWYAARIAHGAAEVTARVNAAMAEARATRPSTSTEDWQTLDGRERHGYRRGMAEALDRVSAALRDEPTP